MTARSSPARHSVETPISSGEQSVWGSDVFAEMLLLTGDLYAAILDAMVGKAEPILRGSLPLHAGFPEVEPAWRDPQAALEAARIE